MHDLESVCVKLICVSHEVLIDRYYGSNGKC
jgi:hypothetical protein